MYQCTLTGVGQNDDIAIRWNVNGISSVSASEWIPYTTSTGVTLVGTDTESTLTIPGNTALNLTILVKCIASGVANGEGYYNTSSDVLYIQGILNYKHIIGIVQDTIIILALKTIKSGYLLFDHYNYC